jgi:lipopolysaccharide transport system ATP-binding protein
MITNIVKPERPVDYSASNNDMVLSVQGVSKKFCRDLKRSLVYGVQDIAGELTGIRSNGKQLRPKEFWALQNINLELRRGEALGLVGPNGSGKTTLMRIIAGLIKPDTGMVKVRGCLAPLIALGAGFNPILTGRENIYANMSILGLTKKEIDYRFDAVIDFAEIGDAIDAPVQSYSSGMSARLGFATAIHTEPDILLIDEVLAVGDVSFKGKCHRKLHELRQKNTSFILINHNPQAILNVCDSAVYIRKGNLISVGDVESIISQYEDDMADDGTIKASSLVSLAPKPRDKSQGLDITEICFKDSQGKVMDSLVSGEAVDLCVTCVAHETIDMVNLNLKVDELGREGNMILLLRGWQENEVFRVTPGRYEFRVHLPYLGLKPGKYSMKVVLKKDSLYNLDTFESFRFSIEPTEMMRKCLFYQPRTWELVNLETFE